jgi:hypothetical protein
MIQLSHPRTWTVWIALALVVSGCDERVVEVAREAADRQAQQNQVMAKLQQEVAESTHGLVAADAAARRDFVAVHHDLQSERQGLDKARTAMELERQALARNRRTESLLVAIVPLVSGAVLLTTLLLFLRQTLQQSTDGVDAELNELLLVELVGPTAEGSESPGRLGTPFSTPALPSSQEVP